MTDSNVFFLNAHEAMQRAGIDTGKVYGRLGIDPELLLQPGVRVPHEAQVPFWAAVEEVTGDPEIGLHLCPHVSPFAGEVIAGLFVSSPTLTVGFERLFRYLRLLSDHLVVQMIADVPGPEVSIGGWLGDGQTPRHAEIMIFYGCLQMAQSATGGRFKPLRVELRCKPGVSPGEFENIFGCPVSFGATEARCYFDRNLLELPLLHANSELAVMQEAIARRFMRRVLRQDIVEEVRQAISGTLNTESCTVQDIAAQLRRSPRRLRSELLDAGTSFNEILAEERKLLAKRLLREGNTSLEQIGYLAGFSERSAFFRAFKRWTGLTPMQYRESHKDGGENFITSRERQGPDQNNTDRP